MPLIGMTAFIYHVLQMKRQVYNIDHKPKT